VADIFPFRALHYNPGKVSVSNILSPPYDVISEDERDSLYARDSLNVVRLEYSKETDPYTNAEKTLGEWLGTGVLTQDDQSPIYLLSQKYKDGGGREVRRDGFIALCRLEGSKKRTILPHEKTFPKPKEDRLKLLSHTRAMFSPIFSIYIDPSKLIGNLHREVSLGPPFLSGEMEGVSHDVWRLTEARAIADFQSVLKGSQVFIADGHHRYETALEYQRTRRNGNPHHIGSEGYNYTMMYFSNVEEEGLEILPIHRVIRGLKGFDGRKFLEALAEGLDVQPFDTTELLFQALRNRGRQSFGIVMSGEQKVHLASIRDEHEVDALVSPSTPKELKQLDVVLLHEYILSRLLKINDHRGRDAARVEFVTDVSHALDIVQRGEAQLAFLLNPTPVEQVQAVARAGLTMPQKSTYFHPKLPAGLVMYNLERF
jgi:uncharacterized protein (DUF1015 family)